MQARGITRTPGAVTGTRFCRVIDDMLEYCAQRSMASFSTHCLLIPVPACSWTPLAGPDDMALYQTSCLTGRYTDPNIIDGRDLPLSSLRDKAGSPKDSQKASC